MNLFVAFAQCFVFFACVFCNRRLGKTICNIHCTVNLHLPLTVKLNMEIVNYSGKMYVSD